MVPEPHLCDVENSPRTSSSAAHFLPGENAALAAFHGNPGRPGSTSRGIPPPPRLRLAPRPRWGLGFGCRSPPGAFHLYCDSSALAADSFCPGLENAGRSRCRGKGIDFGSHPAGAPLRFAYTTYDVERLAEAVQRLQRLFGR